jgi:hypothetical protein
VIAEGPQMSASEGNYDGSHAHEPPPPPEPKTPMWLPAVGAVLFLVVGLIWGLGSSETTTGADVVLPAMSAAPEAGAPH